MPRTADGTHYDYIEQEAKPVIVLIHGLGLTRHTWEKHIEDYTRHFSVLTYDLCGHGDTVLPSQEVTLSLLSKQLYNLLEHLNISQTALVGFSLGGMINRRFILDYPDHVSALVILNSPHERSPENQQLVEQRARASDAGGPAATIETTLERWFTAEFRKNNSVTVDWVRQTVLANDKGNYAAHRFVLAAGVKELIAPTPPITVPTLIMTCENDTGSTPKMSHAIGQEIFGAEVQIVPELQHLGLLEQPDLFTKPCVEFLRKTLGV